MAEASGWCGVLVIIVMSLAPAAVREAMHVGGAGYVDHVIAYGCSALALGLGREMEKPILPLILIFIVLAGGLELAQQWVPGRTPKTIDWLAGTLSACTCLSIARLCSWAVQIRPRLLRSS